MQQLILLFDWKGYGKLPLTFAKEWTNMDTNLCASLRILSEKKILPAIYNRKW